MSSSNNENDLSGLVVDDEAPTQSGGLVIEDDLSGLVEDTASTSAPASPPGTDSGLAMDDDLSGLIENTDPQPAAGDRPGNFGSAPVSPPPAPYTPTAPLPTTAAPINVPPSTPTPVGQPSAPVYSGSTGAYVPSAPAASTMPPPSTDTGAPNLSAPRPAPIEMEGVSDELVTTLSTVAEALPDTKEGFRPKDELPSSELALKDLDLTKTDQEVSDMVVGYFDDDQFRELKAELETLLEDRIPNELSGSKADDIKLATKTIQEALSLFVEDPIGNYDDILYRVAIVKTMLVRRRRLSFWSYRLGIFVLFYGVIFTLLCILGYFIPIDFEAMLSSELGGILLAVWYSGLAGGLGGSVEILWRLYFRVSVKQDFDPQYLMYYLVKPILGFVLGMVIYFVVAAASAITGATTLPQPGSTTGFVIAIFLGFVGGFQQEFVFDMIYTLMKKISPVRPSRSPSSVAPVDASDFGDTSASTSA